MPKVQRPLSPYASEAAILLGQLLRKARIERQMSMLDLAERAGMSRGLLRRIESGDPGCAVGAVFEVAAIVGVQLFDADPPAVSHAIKSNRELMKLLPKSIHAPRTREVKDDF